MKKRIPSLDDFINESVFRPVIGPVDDSTVLAIQADNFKKYSVKKNKNDYFIFDGKNHIATLIKKNDEWQLWSDLSFNDVQKIIKQ